MSSAIETPSLPRSDSSTLALLHPTPEEKDATFRINGASWKGRLSLDAYVQREEYLANQALTRDGGITYWVLVDTAVSSNPRTILASCETLRKRAVVIRQDGRLEESIAHGICSVFCNPDFRGKGYAGRMIKELGNSLGTWQQESRRTTDFTVLFSDIGKRFYTKHGWKPFPSSHMVLEPMEPDKAYGHCVEVLQEAEPLYAEDLTDLCKADEALLRARLGKIASRERCILVALIPDVDTLQWHHAREDFVARELFNKLPLTKGATVKGAGEMRVWCIWTRTFGNETDGNTLNILRLVIEGEDLLELQTSEEGSPKTGLQDSDHERLHATMSVLQAAQREAAVWSMKDVQIWNPTPLATKAIKQLDPAASLIDRDEESIASLRWHGPKLDPVPIHWLGNEKYGWC